MEEYIPQALQNLPVIWRFLPLAGLLLINSLQDMRKKEIFLLPTILVGLMGFAMKIYVLHGEIVASGMTLDSIASWLLMPLVPGLIGLVISLVSKGALGMGDVFMLLAIGAWADLSGMIMICSISLAVMACYGGALFLKKRKRAEIAVVPFLLAAYLLVSLGEVGLVLYL